MRNPDLVRQPNDPNYSHYGGQPGSPMGTLQHQGGQGQAPPPYNGDTSYDSGYDPYGTDVSTPVLEVFRSQLALIAIRKFHNY